MTASDLQAVIKGIGPVVREYVATALLAFGTRLAAVEARAAIPGPRGEQGEQGPAGPGFDAAEFVTLRAEFQALQSQYAALSEQADELPQKIVKEITFQVEAAIRQIPTPKDGINGQDGKDGQDGATVTVDDVLPFIRAEVQQAVAALPPARDGQDGRPGQDGVSVTVDDVLPLIRAELHQAVAALPPPKDGVDGQNGQDGKDGRSVDFAEEVQPVILRAVESTLSSWPKPQDGTSVTVDDVAPIIAAEVQKAVAALPPPKDPIGVLGALIDRDGELVMTLSDGTVKSLGCVVGRDVDMLAVRTQILDELAKWPRPKDGVDGLGFDDMAFALDDAGKLVARFTRGDQVREVRLPGIYDEGVYESGRVYARGSGVTWRRSYWIAQIDTDEMPGTNPRAWRLALKAAQDGKDGKPGPKGETGPQGRAGRDWVAPGKDFR